MVVNIKKDGGNLLPQMRDPINFMEMLINNGDVDKIRALYRRLDLSSCISLLTDLSSSNRKKFISYVQDIIPPKALLHADKTTKEIILELMGEKNLAILLEKLHVEDIVDFVEELNEEHRNMIIQELIIPTRNQVLNRFNYAEDTAGRIMKNNFITINHTLSVQQALGILKKNKRTFTDAYNTYIIIIVDNNQKFLGSISPHQLFNTDTSKIVKDIKMRSHHIYIEDEISTAIHFFREEEATSIPVINHSNKVVGSISVHQAMEYLECEIKEDMLYLGGAEVDDFLSNIFDRVFRHVPWSVLSLFVAFGVALVIQHFEDVISHYVLVVALLPVILAIGGNKATQTMTITIEAIITEKLHKNNFLYFLYKEVATAAINGAIIATIVCFLILVVDYDFKIGMIFSLAIIVQFLFSTFIGIGVPYALKILKFDPALGSSVFVSGIADMSGAAIFLSMTAGLIHRL